MKNCQILIIMIILKNNNNKINNFKFNNKYN